jgi:DNA polymerase IV (DinB-like DNA polymerase)
MDERIIMHVDMDYFYAQVEERDNPSLSGRPVIVCMVSARQGSLGAIASCNYLARNLGLRAGMPCSSAMKIVPQGAYISARKEYYVAVSEDIMQTLRLHCSRFEQVSVDEAYMDVSDKTSWDKAEEYALSVKAAVFKAQRLTCSVGVGPNKLISKMAASARKPNGHTVVKPGEIGGFIHPLSVSKLPGVGEKTMQKLPTVSTIGDLMSVSEPDLLLLFGEKKAKQLYLHSRGLDDSPVTEREKEQYGRLASLKTDTRDSAELESLMSRLSGDVHGLASQNLTEFRTVTVILVLQNMQMKTKSKSLPSPTCSEEVLNASAVSLLREFLSEEPAMVRRLGLTVSNLTRASGQKSLFDF